jgi:hypothetical protein
MIILTALRFVREIVGEAARLRRKLARLYPNALEN